MSRRTDVTRSLNVRFNSQDLAELMRYYHYELGWSITSLGGFIRDMIESFHFMLEENEPKFQGCKLNSIEEAEEILQQFNAGKVNRQNLSMVASQQRTYGEVDPFYRPQTKNPRKNIRRQQRRSMQSSSEQPAQISPQPGQMPKEVWELYQQLDNQEKAMADDLILQPELTWDMIKRAIMNKFQPPQEEEETEQVDSDINKSYEQIEKERKEKDQEQLNEMKSQLSQKPPQHNEENS